MSNTLKHCLFIFLVIAVYCGLAGYCVHSEITKPAPKFKFGDQVKVTLPFYANCSLGTVTELDPITSGSVLTYNYSVDDIDCPYYNRDLHKTEYKRISLIVNEEDLTSKWHTMPEGK